VSLSVFCIFADLPVPLYQISLQLEPVTPYICKCRGMEIVVHLEWRIAVLYLRIIWRIVSSSEPVPGEEPCTEHEQAVHDHGVQEAQRGTGADEHGAVECQLERRHTRPPAPWRQ
jgi:hypothetical protein